MQVRPSLAFENDDLLRADCPGRELFEMITSRWTLLILWALSDGTLRFFQLRDRVEGISERVLVQNLKVLVRAGLVARLVEPTIPPKVSYALQPSGVELLTVVAQLTEWIAGNLEAVASAQAGYDRESR